MALHSLSVVIHNGIEIITGGIRLDLHGKLGC